MMVVSAVEQDAAHIARCLVDVDLRGIRSHTRLVRRYAAELRREQINPAP